MSHAVGMLTEGTTVVVACFRFHYNTQVKGSMVFNDDFLEEEYATLPHYDGTEMDPVSKRMSTTTSALLREPGILNRHSRNTMM